MTMGDAEMTMAGKCGMAAQTADDGSGDGLARRGWAAGCIIAELRLCAKRRLRAGLMA